MGFSGYIMRIDFLFFSSAIMKCFSGVLPFLVSLSLFISCESPKQNSLDKNFQDIQKELQVIAKEAGVPGLQVAYSKGEQSHYFQEGLIKYDSTANIEQNTIFQAASLTKVVASYLFFILRDEGIIDLDTPLLHYYKYDRLENTPDAELITARMVLSHRTGLLNWEGDVPTAEWRATPLTLQFKPGSDYLYSGEGFYFLQVTLEHITGKSFKDLVETYVLNPFNMQNSRITWDDGIEFQAAYGHYSMDKPRNLGKYRNTNAAYTLYTTAEDYTKFIQKALFQGEGLNKESHNLWVSEHSPAKKDSIAHEEDAFVPCALGFRLQKNEKGIAYWHTGSNPGFRCFFLAYPETEEILVAFTNSESGFKAMKPLMQTFLDANQSFWAYDWREGELD